MSEESITMREALLRDIKDLKRERDEAHGALVAQDRRMIAAGHKCGVPFEVFGCDWPDRVAEELIAVAKERNEAREALEHMKRERQTFHEAWKKFCNPFLEAAK